jgi:ribosomal-protein-alanine N-acetyltransferase
MFYIETERLRLIPLTHQLLQLWQVGRGQMELTMGLNPSTMQIDKLYQIEMIEALTHFWLPKTAEFPEQFQWYTNWEIVLKDVNIAIGGIGLGGLPCGNSNTAIGFMLDR